MWIWWYKLRIIKSIRNDWYCYGKPREWYNLNNKCKWLNINRLLIINGNKRR